MFCVNCGNQLEEEWKVCPKCGVEVVRQQKKEQNVEKPKQRVCEKCGNELKEDWLKCPFCGYTEEESYTVREVDTSKDVKKFKFEGFRRTGRFGFQYYKSEVEINDNEIHTVVHKKKDEEHIFLIDEISEIKFPILSVLGTMDIIRIVLFLALMLISKGMSIFAVLFFVKITLVRHMQIKLNDGFVVEIPIRQKAESVEFLKAIKRPESEIQSVEKSAIGSNVIAIREWVISTLMLILAAATIAFGMEAYISERDAENVGGVEQRDTEKALDEVGEYTDSYEENATSTNESIVSLSDWQEAYRVFIEENGKEYSTYSLIYVNDDDIPELVITYGSTAEGMDICTYDGERVRAKGIALSSILYLFKENVIFTSSGHMDNYEDTFWEIRNEEFIEIAKGKYGAEDNADIQLDMYGNPIYQYYWNGVEVSQQEYENELMNRGIEESSSFDPPVERGYYDIMQILLSSINTTIISEYIHEAGYYGETKGYCVYFDGIEDESLQLRIVKDNVLIASGNVSIVDENTAEYHMENDYLVFKFGNSDYFELTGTFGGSTLTDTYHGMWG